MLAGTPSRRLGRTTTREIPMPFEHEPDLDDELPSDEDGTDESLFEPDEDDR
jgi:hypothetical protein